MMFSPGVVGCAVVSACQVTGMTFDAFMRGVRQRDRANVRVRRLAIKWVRWRFGSSELEIGVMFNKTQAAVHSTLRYRNEDTIPLLRVDEAATRLGAPALPGYLVEGLTEFLDLHFREVPPGTGVADTGSLGVPPDGVKAAPKEFGDLKGVGEPRSDVVSVVDEDWSG